MSLIETKADRLVLISGCSGGGKSALLAEFGARGFATVEEPGRRIVREQMASGGDALPWINPAKFAELAALRSIRNMKRAARTGRVTFFDRGLVDAVCAFERMGVAVPHNIARAFAHCRYRRTVFLAPPWEEMFENDAERRHGFAGAVAEYDYLAERLPELGYTVITLPKASIAARANFVVEKLCQAAAAS